MLSATFDAPCLTTFCRLDELGLEATGQRLEPDRAVLSCQVVEADDWCRSCGWRGVPRDTVTRRLAHAPFGHRPTPLLLRLGRYRCTGCGRIWRQDTAAAAEPRAKISRTGLRWALDALVLDHLTVPRVAASLGVAWHTANTAVLEEGRRRLLDDPARFGGVAVLDVDEHANGADTIVWLRTGRQDGLGRHCRNRDGDRDAGPCRCDGLDGATRGAGTQDG